MKEFEESILKMIEETGLNRKEIEEILLIFFKSFQKIMQDLELEITNCDYKQIQAYAHKIKGSSGNLRLAEIYNVSGRLEEASKNEDEELCKKLFIELDNHHKM